MGEKGYFMIRKFTFNRLELLEVAGILILLLGAIASYALYRNVWTRSSTGAGVVDAMKGKEGRDPGVEGKQTLMPILIPLSDAEIGNPMRGAQYYGGEAPPPNWPLTDLYKRYCWRQIEPAQGQYDFTLIDNEIAQAKAAGYTFGFRIMPLNPPAACMPDYLKGVDYDDPLYQQRAQALFTVLGQRYDSNPTIGLLDMSLVGCWGEWNDSCGGGTMSMENRQKIIDMQFQAFPHKRFLMFTDAQDSLDYALNYQRPLRTGVRVDCLGHPHLGGARDTLDNDPIARNQWKVAPLVFEYCGVPYNFARALNDIRHYHASLIGDGDGNINDFSSYSATDRAMIVENNKAAGYRFELNSLTLPKAISPGSSFLVTSNWTNVNTSPAYLPWHVMLQLRSADNKVAWEGQSRLDLQKPFSEAALGNDSTAVSDTFALPINLAHGNYSVCVQILDPNKVYAPLALANKGRTADGAYCSGSVSV